MLVGLLAFHSTKIPVWNFGNFTCSRERYIPVAQNRPKPPRVWLLFLKAGYKRAVLLGDNNFVKRKGTFRFDRLKWPDKSKWTTFKAGPENSGRTKPKWSVPFDVPTEMSGILCWMESALGCMVLCWVIVRRLDCFEKQPLILLAITMWREKMGYNLCPENRPIVPFDTTPTQSQA